MPTKSTGDGRNSRAAWEAVHERVAENQHVLADLLEALFTLDREAAMKLAMTALLNDSEALQITAELRAGRIKEAAMIAEKMGWTRRSK
jgi:hypothetical protein